MVDIHYLPQWLLYSCFILALFSYRNELARGSGCDLEILLPVVKLVLVAFLLEDFPELRRSAEENGDLAFLLLGDVLKDPVPVGAAGVGASLQARDQITLGLDEGGRNDVLVSKLFRKIVLS